MFVIYLWVRGGSQRSVVTLSPKVREAIMVSTSSAGGSKDLAW